jgi:hypothetical protein
VQSINVTSKAAWSGSLTNTLLSAASSALITLIPKELQTVIVNKIIEGALQNLSVYTLPDLSQTEDGVTFSLKGNGKEITLCNSFLCQELKIVIS